MSKSTNINASGLEPLEHEEDAVLIHRLQSTPEHYLDDVTVNALKQEHYSSIASALASRGDAWGRDDVMVLRHNSNAPISLKLSSLPLTIGRSSGADIRIDLHDISRLHCRLERRGALLSVVDLDSKNGTFVNGGQIREQDLCDGDWLQLGPERFLVRRA